MTTEFIYANTLSFFMYDMLETLDKLMTAEARLMGVKTRKREAALKAEIRYAVKDLRKLTTVMTDREQEHFGQTVDGLLRLMLIIADRAEDNPKVLELVTNFAAGFPSKNHINLKRFGV